MAHPRQTMFSGTGRRIFSGGFRAGRKFFSNEIPKNLNKSKNFFDDRTLGLVALLVSVPTV